jgi:hypothetical protein
MISNNWALFTVLLSTYLVWFVSTNNLVPNLGPSTTPVIASIITGIYLLISNFGKMEEKVDKLREDKILDAIKALDEKLCTKIENGDNNLTTKIENVDTNLSAKIEATNKAVTELDTKLSAKIESVDTNLSAKIEATNKAVTELDTKLSAKIESVDTNLSAKIEATNKGILDGDEKLAFKLDVSNKTLEDKIIGKLDIMDSKLSKTQEQVNDVENGQNILIGSHNNLIIELRSTKKIKESPTISTGKRK